MQICYASSGTDAVTNAINLARQASQKRFVFTFNNQYHGKYGTLSGRSNVILQQHVKGEDIVVLPSILDANTATEVLSQFDILLDNSIYTNNTAAVLLELVPIANGGGIPLDSAVVSYLHQILLKHKIKLIVDEVQTGFWRTGKVFAYRHYSFLHPFAVAFGKSIAGGLPLYGTFFNATDMPATLSKGFYSSTFAFNNVSGTAALQVLSHVGNINKFEAEIESKGCVFDMELAGIFPEKLYKRRGLLISLPCDKPASFFLKIGVIVRVINGRLLLTPPLFTDKAILEKIARRIKDAIYVRHD
jgi:acetylornithine/succinyldiaminopimelate/putrescine aminotransferase